MKDITFKTEKGGVILSCNENDYVLQISQIVHRVKKESDERFEFLRHCYEAGVSEIFLVHILNKRDF